MTHEQHRDSGADKVAEFIHDEHFPAHRGAIPRGKDEVVVFGNDGYAQDEKTRDEAGRVWEWANRVGTNLRFGLAADDYTWVIVFQVPKADEQKAIVADADRFVWFAREGAAGFPDGPSSAYQEREARREISNLQ